MRKLIPILLLFPLAVFGNDNTRSEQELIREMQERIERVCSTKAAEIAAEYGNPDYLVIIPGSESMESEIREYVPYISEGLSMSELINERQSQLKKINDEITSFDSDLKDRKLKIGQLDDQIVEKNNTLSGLDSEIVALNEEIESKEHRIDQQKKMIASNDRELRSINQKFADLRSMLTTMGSKLARLADKTSEELIAHDREQQVDSRDTAENLAEKKREGGRSIAIVPNGLGEAQKLARRKLAQSIDSKEQIKPVF